MAIRVNHCIVCFFCDKDFIKKSAKKLQLFTKDINNPPPQRHTNTIQNIKDIVKC